MNMQVRAVQDDGKQRLSMNENTIAVPLIYMPILEVQMDYFIGRGA